MKLAAIGSNCIDFYNNIEGGKPFPGGGPVNMAVYTVRLGGSASYVGPVGDDEYGEVMRSAIAAKGVDTSRLRTKPGRTAVSQVWLNDGERVFGDYDEGVLADYTLSEDDLAFIAEHDVVVCDLWGKVHGQFAELRRRGIATAFDCATRPDSLAATEAIPHTDYLFFSYGGGDGDALRAKMADYHARGPKLVVATLGEKGSVCFDGESYHTFGIVPCADAVDSMGAGDSYIVGFLKGIVEGADITEAMRLGAANASETLKYFGAW